MGWPGTPSSVFPSNSAKAWSSFRYAYYLFADANADGCSSCYVPSLVTRAPLAGEAAQQAAVIETYERDSIWRLRPEPLSVQPPHGVDALTRTLDWEGRRYRYRQVSDDEVVHPLRESEGRIAIHRMETPVGAEAQALRDALLRDLDPGHAPQPGGTVSGLPPRRSPGRRWFYRPSPRDLWTGDDPPA